MVQNGECRSRAGSCFLRGTDAEVIGAIDEEEVKAGWIVEGFQLELLTGRGPVLTSTVESVDVDVDTSTLTTESES